MEKKKKKKQMEIAKKETKWQKKLWNFGKKTFEFFLMWKYCM